MTSPAPVLAVRDLRVRFATKRGEARVVNGVSFELARGETVAIVGESGSGKTVTALALTRLVPEPPGRVEGQVLLDGRDLVTASRDELRQVRGREVGMIFQDPMTSLNPVLPIGLQITEVMEVHLGLKRQAARVRAAELLAMVGIPRPSDRLDDYPHQFSGGMRQRVMIAIGLACDPKILVADEATTALDVTTQAQIVELVNRLQEELGMGVIWITHDLGVVAGIADRVLVMYGGTVVEEAPASSLYADPSHPYTRSLLGALPVLGSRRARLASIPGRPPDPVALPPGCLFHPRCPVRGDERCVTQRPALRPVRPGHLVASWYEATGADASGT